MNLKDLMKNDDFQYISLIDFIELVANQTGDSPDLVIHYLVKRGVSSERDVKVYRKGFLDAYGYEGEMHECLLTDTPNDTRPSKFHEIISDKECSELYILKKEVFNASYIRVLNLDYDMNNQPPKQYNRQPRTACVPFGKRIDLISKDLPQNERIKKSYEIYGDNISFYEDTHPVNTPDEMIKRIQGLLSVIRKKDQKIAELQKQIDQPNESNEQETKCEKQAKTASVKPAITEQQFNWQDMDEYIYPPELHLALMIWQRIYMDNELKNSHVTSHSGKYEIIANKMNLNPYTTLGKRIGMIINNAYSKKKQSDLAKQLDAIEALNMPKKS